MEINVENKKPYLHLETVRRTVQIVSMLLFIFIPVLNGFGIKAVIGTLYSISIGKLDISDPVMVVQTILLTKSVYIPLILSAVLPIVIALIFGKVFCSWVCPHNTISEWIHTLEKKIFPQRWRQVHHFKRSKNPKAYWFWIIFCSLLILTLVVGLPLLSYLSAPGIITSAIAQGISGMGFGLEIGIVLLILAIEGALFRRYWCKFACPVGAFLGLFQTKKTLRIVFNEAACDCKPGTAPCYTICPLQLAPKEIHDLYPYCFNCGLCVSFCERAGRALTLRFGEGENK